MNRETKKRLPVVVYTPERNLQKTTVMVKEMVSDLVRSRGLAWRLMVRDISARYRQSMLGIFWAFMPPLATAMVFVVLNKQRIINVEDTGIPYPAFAIIGTVLWQVFVDSMNAPLKVVTAAKPMLTKINFPKEALILSGLGQTLFSFAVKMAVIIPLFFIYNIPFTISTLFSIPAVFILILLGTTFGLFLTPLGILYTDVMHSMTIITNIWFFITPVVYPPPKDFPFSLLATVNPVSPILIGVRDIATDNALNNPVSFFAVTIIMFVILFFTWIIYRVAFPILAERMSA